MLVLAVQKPLCLRRSACARQLRIGADVGRSGRIPDTAMPPLRIILVSSAFCLSAAAVSGIVIFFDPDHGRLVTTENHRTGEISYRHAVAAAMTAEGRRRVDDARDLIGQAELASGRQAVAAPLGSGASGAGVPARTDRTMVRRDQATQAITLCNRGLLLMQSGKLTEAVEAFEKAMKLNPGDARAVMLRGVAAARQGRHEAALDYYNKALELNPVSVEAYQSRGLALMKLDRLPQAIEDFTKVVTLDPKFEEGFIRRGLAYGRTGEFAKAIADNTAAIALNPKNPLSYNNRAAAHKALGQEAEAAADVAASQKLEAEARK